MEGAGYADLGFDASYSQPKEQACPGTVVCFLLAFAARDRLVNMVTCGVEFVYGRWKQVPAG